MRQQNSFLHIFMYFVVTSNLKLYCELQTPSWTSNQTFRISHNQVVVHTIYGVDLVVDDTDLTVSKFIKETGSWQPRNLRNFARFVKEEDTIINVGSHIGIESVVMGSKMSPNSRIFMFQPLSFTHNMALKNVYLNDLQNIASVYNVGAGSKYSVNYQYIFPDNTGRSTIKLDPNYVPGADEVTEIVQVDVIDDILPSDVVLSFALVDTQRLELEVFMGMRKVIQRSPNLIICVEWSGAYFDTIGQHDRMVQVVNWFIDHKFKFYRLNATAAPTCNYDNWYQISTEFLFTTENYPDILIVPQHIDPNTIDF